MSKAMKGRIFTEEWKRKMRENHKGTMGMTFSEEWRKNLSLARIGNKNACKFGHGLWDDLEYRRKYHREYYHKNLKKMRAIISARSGLRRQYGSSKNYTGLMCLIQKIYEENIKQNGTLTCYLCKQQIPFGDDHLEHKIPLSRGGTNEKANLDIACKTCNFKKQNKTEEEYRKEL